MKIKYFLTEWERSEEETDLMELLRRIPSLLRPGPFPPRSVINDVLTWGRYAGGPIVLEWTPINLTEAQYDELVESTAASDATRQKIPDWVTTYEDWVAWTMFIKNGVPVVEHRQHLHRIRELEDLEKACASQGQVDAAEAAKSARRKEEMQYAEFLNKHLFP
jgi:hypothetical protein